MPTSLSISSTVQADSTIPLNFLDSNKRSSLGRDLSDNRSRLNARAVDIEAQVSEQLLDQQNKQAAVQCSATVKRLKEHTIIQIEDGDAIAAAVDRPTLNNRKAVIISVVKSALALAPNLLSLGTIGTTAAIYGMSPAPSIATIASLCCNLLSIGSTAKTFHGDYKGGFANYTNMDYYRISQLTAESALNVFATTQGIWGLHQALIGNFADNKFMVDNLVKRAFDGDWKDYSHAVLGVFSGIFRAIANAGIVRNSDQLLEKVNSLLITAKLPKMSRESFRLLQSVAGNIATLGYPLYDCKHSTKVSSYANHFQEFFIPQSASNLTAEAVLSHFSSTEEPTSAEDNSLSTSEEAGLAINALVVLAMMGKTLDFIRR